MDPNVPPAEPGPAEPTGIVLSDRASLSVSGDLVAGDKIVGYTSEQVRLLLADIRSSFQPKPFDGRSPYVGLAAFQEQDASRFFGREKLTQELVARVAASRHVIIAGPSGTGKSSVARAGVMAALRQGALPGSETWLYETMTPGRHPITELGRVVGALTKDLKAQDDLLQQARADAARLHRWAEIALGDQRSRRVILLVDQFEEVFTQVADEAERVSFLNQLLYAANAADGRVTVMCTTRSDFIGSWASYPNLNAWLSGGVNQIPPMQPDELVSAIARPALQVGLQIDPDLVKQVLDDMENAPGALPLMQFALQDLFEYEKSKGGVIALTRADYLERGGLQKALARHADAEFDKLSAEEQQLARRVFAGLIEPGRGSVDTKRTALFSELVPAGRSAAQVQAVISKLADARLVTTDQLGAQETITLAHERLIDAWAWLRRLVDENREAIALQNQVIEDAHAWEQHGRDGSYLYSGARLATAREQLEANKITPSGLAKEFLQASIHARQVEQAREQQRTRRLLLAFGAAAVVFAALALLAFWLQQRAVASEQGQVAARETAQAESTRAVAAEATAVGQARVARSRELAAVALNQLAVDPERAVLIALEANASAETFEAKDALRQGLSALPLLRTLDGHTSNVTLAVFSPDGKKIVTASSDKTARLWDVVGDAAPLVLAGHTGLLTSAEFSPDGKLVVTAAADSTARLWDAKSGALLFVLQGHQKGLHDAHFSHDGSRVVTASGDGTAKLWETQTGALVATLTGHTDDVADAQFSPDDARVVTASNDKTARVWDARTGAALYTLSAHSGVVSGAQFSPDGTRLVTISGDATARLWDAATGAEIAVLNGHEGFINSIAFSQAGNLVATASGDGTARLWDARSGAPLALLRGHTSEVYDAEFSADGKRLVTASRDNTARIWDVASREQIALLRGHNGPVRSARFSPDGKLVVTASSDRTARVWDSAGGHELATLLGHRNAVNAAHFAPDGSEVITASRDDTARIWDVLTGGSKLELTGHSKDLIAAEFSSAGQVLTASLDNTARLWDAATGKLVAVLSGHTDILRAAHFSPDGKAVLTTSSDKEARVWDSASGALRARLIGHGSAILTGAFSPDGQRVVTAGLDKTARVWDANTGKPLLVLQGHQDAVMDASFSPDGTRIVTAGSDDTARVWDAETGALVHTLQVQDNLRVAEFSSDGKRILTAGNEGVVTVWDAVTGAKLAAMAGHRGAILSAHFSPDGRWIVSAGADGTARLWNATNYTLDSVLYGHTSTVSSAEFSRDSSRVLTASQDNTARVYLVSRADLIALAQSRVTRALDCSERVRFLAEPLACPTSKPNPTTTP